MNMKLMSAMVISLLLVASVTTQGGIFIDRFETPHDYVAQGIAGTGWDGFIGLGPGEAVTALDASTTRPGELYLSSAGAGWPGTTLGPFLYKEVSGDFVATVRVTDYTWVDYEFCGLMARVAPRVDAGEDWVAIDYFPMYDNDGDVARWVDNGTLHEDVGGNGTGTNPHSWLQLERKGDVFTLRTSPDGVTWIDYPDANYSPLTRADMNGLPVQVGLWQATFTSNLGSVAFDDFTIVADSLTSPTQAVRPTPVTGAMNVRRDVTLSWTPGAKVIRSDVYFGTSMADVNAAGRTNPLGVLVAKAQDANVYVPAGVLAYGQTYYWRIDGIDAAGAVLDAGTVWRFTVEPVGYPMASTRITATASSAQAGRGPENTINGSGLTGDLHGTDPNAMWVSDQAGPEPVWIQYTFDRTYRMHELWVWNYNGESEPGANPGPKDVTIQYSADGTDWATWGDFVFSQAPGTQAYAHNTTIPLGSILADRIRIIVKAGWSDQAACGLSEVRFFYIPVWAREPRPVGTDVDPRGLALTWRAGREAASHHVYLGTDSNAVRDATAGPAVSAASSYVPAPVDLSETYYWRVDEVNAAASPGVWTGEVWSFSTLPYYTIDDFESYNDDQGTAIFEAWVDGFDTSNNGATVGKRDAPYAEQNIVHGGRQSMPFFYDNNGDYTFSEGTRTLRGSLNSDWVTGGVTTLVIFFRGEPDNAPGQLYVKINGTEVDFTGDAAALATPIWKQWNIDLAGIAGLEAVDTLTIGVTGSGRGALYFDDIRLYKDAPGLVAPVDPGPTNLMACFTMENNEVKDSSGHGYLGTLNDILFTPSVGSFGKAAQFNGTTAYVDMGTTFSSGLIRNLTSCTFAAWVYYPAAANRWGRVFDFGNPADGTGNPTICMFLTTRNGANAPQFAITTTGPAGESTAGATSAPTTGWHHLAAVVDASTMRMAFYLDGNPEQTDRPTTTLPKDLGATEHNWLGRSQNTMDPYLNGAIDEFRIYNRALTAGEIRYLAGDR